MPASSSQSRSESGSTNRSRVTSRRGRGQRAALTLGRVGEAGANVVAFELGKIGQNLLLGHTSGQVFQHIADRDPRAPDTRLPESNSRIRDDAIQ